jgi:hypothetical protein
MEGFVLGAGTADAGLESAPGVWYIKPDPLGRRRGGEGTTKGGRQPADPHDPF